MKSDLADLLEDFVVGLAGLIILLPLVLLMVFGCDECSTGENKCVDDSIVGCADGAWQETIDCSELIDFWSCCEDTAGEADCGECK